MKTETKKLKPMMLNNKRWDQDAVMDYLLSETANSSKSMASILKDAPHDMPTRMSIYSWLDKKPDYQRRFSIAKEAQAEFMADELISIADDSSDDYVEEERNGKTVMVFNSENIQRSRLKVDARKWVISKLLPNKYGDRVQQVHEGSVSISLNSILQDIDGADSGLPEG